MTENLLLNTITLFSIDISPQDIIDKLFPSGIGPVIVQLCAFGVLVLFGFVFGYKPVKNIIEARKDYIEKHIKDAEEQDKQSALRLKEAEDNILESKKEARNIVNKAKADGVKQYDAMLAQAQEDIRRNREEADEEIKKAKEKAIEDVHNEIVEVALTASKTILNREINDEDNRKLVEQFMKEVDQ
ncbi:MAG: F0F1 ATP synthase subunit B [Bacilli bacterium]|nr:F0F1 ATP synthase subunit B [Bacilli bacterium]